jgi:ABC-2 type transport system ATP-binding protein
MHENGSAPPLVVENLTVWYPGKEVLKGLNLRIEPGEVYGLLGRNGSGKTTLLNTVMRLLEPLEGTIRCFGGDTHRLAAGEWKRISHLGEMAGVLPHWSVRRLATFQEACYGRLRRDWVDRFFTEFSIDRRSTLGSLSRGQQQMVGLILAIAVEPDLLLFDEPAAGLDPVARRELLGKVLDLMGDRNTATAITSHILSDLERIVDRVGFLDGGRIVLEGTLDDLKERCALVPWADLAPLPAEVKVLRRRADGLLLVTGDLATLGPVPRQRLGLEDLFVEFLGSGGGGA